MGSRSDGPAGRWPGRVGRRAQPSCVPALRAGAWAGRRRRRLVGGAHPGARDRLRGTARHSAPAAEAELDAGARAAPAADRARNAPRSSPGCRAAGRRAPAAIAAGRRRARRPRRRCRFQGLATALGSHPAGSAPAAGPPRGRRSVHKRHAVRRSRRSRHIVAAHAGRGGSGDPEPAQRLTRCSRRARTRQRLRSGS
jgi:hypothetical protein